VYLTRLLARLTMGGNAMLVEEFPPSRTPRAKRLPPMPTRAFQVPAQGCTLRLPEGFRIVWSFDPVVTVLAEGATRVSVFRENVAASGLETYLKYKSAPIRTGDDPVELQRRCSYGRDGRVVYELRWRRRSLARVPDDAEYYATLDLVISSGDVLSVHIKTPDASWFDTLLPGLVERVTAAAPGPAARVVRGEAGTRRMSPVAAALLTDLAEGSQRLGIYEPGAPRSLQTLHELEHELEFRFPFLLLYTDLTTPDVEEQLRAAAAMSRTVELTLHTPREGIGATSAYFYDVLEGVHDVALRSYARHVRNAGCAVLFRLNNEMNGDWCRYCAYWTSQDPELFRAAWQHCFHVFAEEGATNAL
jgi:hypothetical protein